MSEKKPMFDEPGDQQPSTPKSESEYLADEIESVGRGLGIMGKSLQGGRLLLPDEDALIVKALRAFAQSERTAIDKSKRREAVIDALRLFYQDMDDAKGFIYSARGLLIAQRTAVLLDAIYDQERK